MRNLKLTMFAAALCVAGAGAAAAAAAHPWDRGPPPDRGDTPGLGYGSGGRNGGSGGGPRGGSLGAPGPVAGAGLPFLLLAGGYGVYRHLRRRAEKARPKSEPM